MTCNTDCKEMKIADGMCLQCPKRKKHDDSSNLLTPVLLGLAASASVPADKKAVDKEPSTHEAYDVQEGTSELESLVDSVCDFGE